ncbi:MAG TPA: MHS family MFS transporter [Candidatus Corynebacterium avicola]|uniref:Putative proline/betaine transporter n=1 Tax=Candidatus Corynebacterium avicola TaxID=2838527 RepID=A0A9D1RTN9_9CORY|nr:MHS family MFS transporter [Candidatus Corynebacterium avicola]
MNAETTETSVSPPTTKQIRRAVLASTIGTTVEWYDFALFGTASALVFNRLFFPDLDPLFGTVAAFAISAVGFFVRPLGGFVFGIVGDKYGRRSVLIITLALMGTATVCMGLLPTYAQIGLWAPTLLILLRALQGFGSGAEFAGAVIMVAEYAPPKYRTLLSSFPVMGNMLGGALGAGFFSLLSTLLSHEQMTSWGWRVPFFVGALGLAVGMWVRYGLEETPKFRAMQKKADKKQEEKRTPLRVVFKKYPKQMAAAMLSVFAESAPSYLIKTFTITYLASFLLVDERIGLNAVTIASLVGIFTTPMFGFLGDRYGAKKVYMIAIVAMVAMIFPFFLLIGTKLPVVITLAVIVIYGFGVRALGANLGLIISGYFPTEVRYSGCAISKEIATALSGGVSPMIATGLLAWSQSFVPVAIYIIAVCIVSFLALLLGPKNQWADKEVVEEEKKELAAV